MHHQRRRNYSTLKNLKSFTISLACEDYIENVDYLKTLCSNYGKYEEESNNIVRDRISTHLRQLHVIYLKKNIQLTVKILDVENFADTDMIVYFVNIDSKIVKYQHLFQHLSNLKKKILRPILIVGITDLKRNKNVEVRLANEIGCCYMEINKDYENKNVVDMFEKCLIVLQDKSRNKKYKSKNIRRFFFSKNKNAQEMESFMNYMSKVKQFHTESCEDIESYVEKIDLYIKKCELVYSNVKKDLTVKRLNGFKALFLNGEKNSDMFKMKIGECNRIFTQIKIAEDKYFTVKCEDFGNLNNSNLLLVKIVAFITQFHLDNDDMLFRKSPDIKEYNQYKSQLIIGESVPLGRIKDVHVICCLFKDFIKAVKNPNTFFPFDILKKFNVDYYIKERIIFQFQRAFFGCKHFETAELLFNFFKKLESKNNKLDLKSVATLFAPSLIRTDDKKNKVKHFNLAIDIIEYVTKNVSEIFDEVKWNENKLMFNDKLWVSMKDFVKIQLDIYQEKLNQLIDDQNNSDENSFNQFKKSINNPDIEEILILMKEIERIKQEASSL